MKKLYYLIILTVILGLVLTGCSLLSNISQVPDTGQSGISYLTKSPGPGLVGLWHFDTDANDSTANHNDGTLMGGAYLTTGYFGNALSFDGSDDYVLVTHDGSLMFNSGDFSVELWAKLADMSGYDGLITTDIAGDAAWKIYRDNNQSYFRARYGSTVVQYPTVSAGDWHYYGYVKNGTTLSIYFDGDFVISNTCPATHAVTGTELVLGSYRIQNAKDALHMYNGLIDEVRIWDVALDEDAILQSYELGGPQTEPCVVQLSHQVLASGEVVCFTSSFYLGRQNENTDRKVDIYIMSESGDRTIEAIGFRHATPAGTDGKLVDTTLPMIRDTYGTADVNNGPAVGKKDKTSTSIHLYAELDVGDPDPERLGVNAQYLPWD